MNYRFGLYNNDQLLDETNLNENDPDHAMYLFMNEYGWGEKLPLEQLDVTSVVLIDEEEEPDDYKYSTEIHPKKLKICSANKNNSKALAKLKACPDFALPEDHQDDDPNVYCKYCWAVGCLSVCLKYKNEEE